MSNPYIANALHLGTTFLVTFALLLSFYYYFKAGVFKLAPIIAKKTKLIQHYPFSQVVGTIELSIVAVSHVIFCLLLLYFFKVNIRSIFMEVTFTDCLYGALLGIGSVGISVLFCTVAIKAVEIFAKDKAPCSLTGWAAISNAGWIRHHKHTIKILPIFIALLIITMQIGSEETIFRSVLLQAFAPFGIATAFSVSTLLFIFMQTFHMPSMLSAMFPMIGATIMGVIHGLLYIYHPSVVPLIISHLTFFIFTVI
jgi:membrane protease YdiL (CAAX protease family)